MSRHSVLCRDSRARHCIATKLCVRNRDALSRQCGAALRRNREGHVRMHDRPGRARTTRLARQGWARTKEVFYCDRLRTVVKKKK